jgi:hypothetical protein
VSQIEAMRSHILTATREYRETHGAPATQMFMPPFVKVLLGWKHNRPIHQMTVEHWVTHHARRAPVPVKGRRRSA